MEITHARSDEMVRLAGTFSRRSPPTDLERRDYVYRGYSPVAHSLRAQNQRGDQSFGRPRLQDVSLAAARGEAIPTDAPSGALGNSDKLGTPVHQQITPRIRPLCPEPKSERVDRAPSGKSRFRNPSTWGNAGAAPQAVPNIDAPSSVCKKDEARSGGWSGITKIEPRKIPIGSL